MLSPRQMLQNPRVVAFHDIGSLLLPFQSSFNVIYGVSVQYRCLNINVLYGDTAHAHPFQDKPMLQLADMHHEPVHNLHNTTITTRQILHVLLSGEVPFQCMDPRLCNHRARSLALSHPTC